MSGDTGVQKGIALTVEVIIALLLTFMTLVIAFSMLNSARPSAVEFAHMRVISFDTLSVLEKTGALTTPFEQIGITNGTNTTIIRDVLRQTPPFFCAKLDAYSNSSYVNYTITKDDCDFSAEDFQVAWRTFPYRVNSTNCTFFTAKLTSWYKRVGTT
jgi:hypothetical protein